MNKLKVCPVCPMCKSPHDREVDPGVKVTCPDCDEVYRAEAPEPTDPVARPMTRAAADKKSSPADKDRDEKGKPGARTAAKKSAAAARPRRAGRESAGGGRVLLVLAGGIGGLVLLAAVGGGFLIWALTGKDDKPEAANQFAANPAPAAPAAPVPQPQPTPTARTGDPDLGPRPVIKRPTPAPVPRAGQSEAKPPVAPAPMPRAEEPESRSPAAPTPAPRSRSVPRPQPAEPPKPAEPAGPEVPPFVEPANPFKAGTQVKLRELRRVELPAPPPAPKAPVGYVHQPPEAVQLAFAPAHELLFVRQPHAVWVYDVKAGKEVGAQRAKERFTDLSLSPDGAAVFAADYGGEHIGYGNPLNPNWVHRFDPEARTWEARKAPKIAWRMEAVDAHRVLLVERDQWIAVSLNKWEQDGVGVRELSRIGCGRSSDLEYNPRTGRLYFANGTNLELRGDKVVAPQGQGRAGQVGQPAAWGSTVALSRDGARLYSGAVQVDAAEPTNVLEKFPEPILAASRDVAFGAKAYYRAATGSTLGEYPFPTEDKPARRIPYGQTTPAAVHVSPDGISVWVWDQEKNAAVQFALDGEKKAD